MDPMPQLPERRSLVVALLLLLTGCGVYLAAFASQVNRNPLRVDEVDFFQCMRNITVLGKPLYYAGEIDLPENAVLPLSTKILAGRSFRFYRFKPETGILKETFFAVTDGDSRYTYCLWHPPLYVYLGGLFLRLFDLTIAQAALLRYTHLVFALGMFIGMGFLVRELYRPAWLLGLALSALFLATNSLAVRAGLLVDYNGALAQCAAVWLAWAFLRAVHQPRAMPLATVLLALTFAVGLGVGASMLLGLLLWTLIFRHRLALIRQLAIIVAGVLLFVVAFWLFARVADLPFSQPFLHNFQRAGLQASLASRLAAVVRFAGWYAREIGLVGVVVGLLLGLNKVRLRRADRLLLPTLVLVAMLSQAGLSGDAYGFPKYIAFALPLLFAFVGSELGVLAQAARWRPLAAAVVFVLVLAQTWQTADVLARPGGTLYVRGEQGFLPAANAVGANSQPSETLLSSRDVAFYANRKFLQWSGALLTDPSILQRRVENEQVTAIVASRAQLGATSPEVAAWVTAHTTLIFADGDFQLLQMR